MKKKSLNKIYKQRFSQKDIPPSKALSIIVTELKKAGKFRSCLIVDENGLTIADAINIQANKEDLSASIALGGEFIERFQEYLKMGAITLSTYETSSSRIWLKRIVLPHTNETFILFASKDKSWLDKLGKSSLELLRKQQIYYNSLIDVASQWILVVSKG